MIFDETAITSSDKTFFQLRKDIVDGQLAAGEKLSEPDLSKKYQVSRAIVREAINRLESCRLVERKANVGARVVSISVDNLISLYQVRESLEGMAARLAATNMSDDEISDLQQLIRNHLTTVESGHNYYQEAGDVDFHYRVVLGSKNNHLISMLTEGIYHLIRMYRVQLGMTGPRITTAYDEHRSIVQAIANRDGELAEILMRRHISYTQNTMRQRLLEKAI